MARKAATRGPARRDAPKKRSTVRASAESGRTSMSANDASRLLLLGQGLLDDPAGRADSPRLLRVVEGLGYVQIDSINAVERAHHLTLLARLDDYRPTLLAALLEKRRDLFEQWTHDASAIPTAWYRHWHPRFERSRRRIQENRWWRERMGGRPAAVLGRVLERIRAEGPLLARDFLPDRPGESGSWWGWRPEKAALEYLWRTGDLAVVRRARFEKVYDLAERVLPEHHASAAPTAAEHVDWACSTALERTVVATPREIAGFWGAVDVAAARRWCEKAVRDGRAAGVVIAGRQGDPPWEALAVPNWRQRLEQAPSPPDRMRALSPFDPLARDRQRLLRAFGFDYRFEAFVPAAKRQYGYYTLPLLEGDRFVGRLSARTDRKAGALIVEGLWWERGVKATRQRKSALGEALERVARLAGANRVR